MKCTTMMDVERKYENYARLINALNPTISSKICKTFAINEFFDDLVKFKLYDKNGADYVKKEIRLIERANALFNDLDRVLEPIKDKMGYEIFLNNLLDSDELDEEVDDEWEL